MRYISKFFLSGLLLSVFTLSFAPPSNAERLCVKKSQKVAKNSVNFVTGIVKVSGNCPSGYVSLVDTASFKGATGAQGEKGEKGDTGLQGPAGAQGIQGATGPQGEVGPQGQAGPQGEVGPQGQTGAQGAQGDTGPAGAGLSGYLGSARVASGGGTIVSRIRGANTTTISAEQIDTGYVELTFAGTFSGLTGSDSAENRDKVIVQVTPRIEWWAVASANVISATSSQIVVGVARNVFLDSDDYATPGAPINAGFSITAFVGE